MNIVDLAIREADKAGAGRIKRVEIELGALAGVMADSLLFCFAAACRDTPVAGARLVISEKAGLGQCASCDLTAEVSDLLTLCPACGGIMRPVGGRELRLVSIDVE